MADAPEADETPTEESQKAAGGGAKPLVDTPEAKSSGGARGPDLWKVVLLAMVAGLIGWGIYGQFVTWKTTDVLKAGARLETTLSTLIEGNLQTDAVDEVAERLRKIAKNGGMTGPRFLFADIVIKDARRNQAVALALLPALYASVDQLDRAGELLAESREKISKLDQDHPPADLLLDRTEQVLNNLKGQTDEQERLKQKELLKVALRRISTTH